MIRRRLKDFPVCLQLEGLPVLVVGAGVVATRRIAALLDAGAVLTVVAPEASREIRELAQSGKLLWHQRGFRACDLEGARFGFAATSVREVNREVAAAARARGVLVNTCDDPPACDFTMPAVTRRGVLTVAVSSGGTNPTMAAGVRDALADALPPVDAVEACRARRRHALRR